MKFKNIDNGQAEQENPITVTDLMRQTAENYPNHTALMYKDKLSNEWRSISFKEYRERVEYTAKVFIKLGLEKNGAVAVLASNSAEWFISELAAIHAGGKIVGIYATSSIDACHHILESSKANIVVVDDDNQMNKIRALKNKLSNLKAVIQTDATSNCLNNEDGYWQWNELTRQDLSIVEEEYQRRKLEIVADECCCLIYTSGTVGLPKGVMLSHDNVTFNARAVKKRWTECQMGKEIIVSYLPLSHIGGQISDIFLPLTTAATVYFADRDAMKGSLLKTLIEVQPSYFFGVPRVFDKIIEKFSENDSKSAGNNVDRSQMKFNIGMSRATFILTGGAPFSIEAKKEFSKHGLSILDTYGMSECGSHTIQDTSSDTSGKALGMLTKIHNPNAEGHGEICVKGRNVFMGYLNDEAKTREVFDDEGWFHSGDLGYIDNDDNLHITGRIKEIVITAGGENISPVNIENLVKSECMAISNAILVGDRRKYLTMLLTLKIKTDAKGMFMDDLAPETVLWLNGINLSYTKLSEILNAGPDVKVLQEITRAVDRANQKSQSKAHKVQKFAILPHDFSIFTGELGPTLKVKRNEVLKMYSEIIENLYK